jgi:rhamnosyltransferase
MAREACGVVVTFHPELDVVENLTKLRAQIERVIVVDNGSTEAELAWLRAASRTVGFELIENGENLGIATAMNIGIRRGEALGSRWVFQFDQDSCVTDGFAEAMVSAFESSPADLPLGILVPLYQDKRSGEAMAATLEPDGRLESVMTSGSLMRMKTLQQYGLLRDELFIDGVDHELSLRLRAAGFRLAECASAVLLHSPGTPSSFRVIRKRPFQSANYSPVRRYYQERNKIWLVRRYWRTFPDFCKRQFRVSAKEGAKIVLFEGDKVRKLRYFLWGWWDGLRGRTGRRD